MVRTWGPVNTRHNSRPRSAPVRSRFRLRIRQRRGPLKHWLLCRIHQLRSTNVHAKASQTFSGVPLIDLLIRLGVPDKPHGQELRLYLVAEGADGYQVVYSVSEVSPDVHDAIILVADSLDGEPIAANGDRKSVVQGKRVEPP